MILKNLHNFNHFISLLNNRKNNKENETERTKMPSQWYRCRAQAVTLRAPSTHVQKTLK